MENLKIKIFNILLNRNPSHKEFLFCKKLNLIEVKNYIKKSKELKNFNNYNQKAIKDIIYEILTIEPKKIDLNIFITKFINLRYNKIEMKLFIYNLIEDIKKKYSLIYLNYLDVKTEISNLEIIDILEDVNNIESYVCIQDKFLKLSNEKFNLLINE